MESNRGIGITQRPEIKYKAKCASCDTYINAWRGFSDGRVYNHKLDGLLCEKCGNKPTNKRTVISQGVLVNSGTIEARLDKVKEELSSLYEELANLRTSPEIEPPLIIKTVERI